MPAKIMWLSQHAPSERQLKALGELYPGFELLIDARSFDGADDILERYRASGAADLVVVGPWTFLRELVNRGLRPLYAVMSRVPCSSSQAEVRVGHGPRMRCFHFDHFARVAGVELKLHRAEPLPSAASSGRIASPPRSERSNTTGLPPQPPESGASRPPIPVAQAATKEQ